MGDAPKRIPPHASNGWNVMAALPVNHGWIHRPLGWIARRLGRDYTDGITLQIIAARKRRLLVSARGDDNATW
jgi:hypothetical protein